MLYGCDRIGCLILNEVGSQLDDNRRPREGEMRCASGLGEVAIGLQ